MTPAIRTTLLIAGSCVFGAGILVGANLALLRHTAMTRDAQAATVTVFNPSPSPPNTPEPPPPPCAEFVPKLEAVSTPRIMSERESHPLVVEVTAGGSRGECEVWVEVTAARFEVSPADETQRVVLGTKHNRATLRWIIAPKEPGEYTIGVTARSAAVYGDYWTIGIVVTNVLGLRAGTAQLFAYVAWALGSALTVPWWLERIMGRRQKRRQSR